MTIEEFWNKYAGKGENGLPSVVSYYEYFKKGFEDGLPHKMREEYDIGEIIVEITGHNKSFKEFEKVDEFVQLIEKEYPEEYAENSQFFHSELIPYYLVTGNEDRLQYHLNKVQKQANDNLDEAWEVLLLLLCFNKIDTYCDFLHEVYLELEKQEFNPFMEELGSFKYNLVLSEIFEKHLAKETIDYSSYKDIEQIYSLQILEIPIQEDLDILDEEETMLAWELVKDKHEGAFHIFKIRFAKYARQKGISFPIAFYIFDKIKFYWLENDYKENDFFAIKPKDFYDFIRSLGGMFGVLEPEMYAFLYGSFYVYDFLLSNNVIDEQTHHQYKMVHANTREKILSNNYFSLWQYPFIHDWEAPDGWEEEWHNKEKELFKDSLNLTYYQEEDQKKKEKVLEEFKEFLPPKRERNSRRYRIPERKNPFANLDFSQLDEPKTPKIQIPSREIDLDSRLPKIGRNEKVTVKYGNGTIKKDIKYKKVKRDVESGKCKVI